MKLRQLFNAHKRLWRLQAEVQHLRREIAVLQARNDSMRAGMRRCVNCEYRLDFKQRHGREAPVERASARREDQPHDTSST